MSRLVKILSVTLCLWLIHFLALAQEPASFKLGEAELEAEEVYSIITSSKNRLFVSTNSGIFAYEQGQFKPLTPCKSASGTSLFGLIEDNRERLFCHNLSGYIFEVTRDSIIPYLKVPEEFISNRINLFADEKGALHFFSKRHCFNVSSRQLVPVYSEPNTAIGIELSALKNGRILFSTNRNTTYQELRNDSIQERTIEQAPQDSPTDFRSFFSLNNHLIVAYNNGVLHGVHGNLTIRSNYTFKNRFTEVAPNEVWALLNTKGVNAIRLQNGKIQASETYFEDHFISCAFTSSNGTVYLGTFGKGLIVIPNRNTNHVYSGSNTGIIKDIVVANDSTLFLSQMGKGIVRLKNNRPKIIQQEKKEFFSKLFWIENASFNILPDLPHLYFDHFKKTGNGISIPTVQDVALLDNRTSIFATSKGIWLKGVSSNLARLDWSKRNEQLYALKSQQQRTRSIAFDPINRILFASGLNSTYAINSKGQKTELLYNALPFLTESMTIIDQQLFCATKTNGVLVFKNLELINKIEFSDVGNNLPIKQVKIHKGNLYALVDGVVAIRQLATDSVHYIDCFDGVCEAINKFELSPNKLWLLTKSSKIISIDLPLKKPANSFIKSRLLDVSVWGKSIDPHRDSLFSFDRNKFTFKIEVDNPVIQKQASLFYRVAGFEESWNQASYNNVLVEYKYLPPGDYVFEYYPKYLSKRGEIKQYRFSIAAPYWFEWWFIGLMTLICCGVVLLIFRYRLRAIRKQQRNELQKKELKADFIEAELRALRSQMNPHFIFNALNSIQALILKADIDRSYDYMVLFSKLVRKTLHYSNEAFIELTSELEFLEIYLSIEKLRFDDSFEYELRVNCDMDIKIPSLVIQPFIENALTHGLQHKESDKHLSIVFDATESLLTCTIIDNGIGRSAAQEINQRLGSNHTSFALESIKKRLDMYQSELKQEIGFTIENLKQDGSGTKVVLVLPIRYI